MKVQFSPYNYSAYKVPNYSTKPTFKGGIPVETIKNCSVTEYGR